MHRMSPEIKTPNPVPCHRASHYLQIRKLGLRKGPKKAKYLSEMMTKNGIFKLTVNWFFRGHCSVLWSIWVHLSTSHSPGNVKGAGVAGHRPSAKVVSSGWRKTLFSFHGSGNFPLAPHLAISEDDRKVQTPTRRHLLVVKGIISPIRMQLKLSMEGNSFRRSGTDKTRAQPYTCGHQSQRGFHYLQPKASWQYSIPSRAKAARTSHINFSQV